MLLLLLACSKSEPDSGTTTPIPEGDLMLDPGFIEESVQGSTTGGPVTDAVCPGSWPDAPGHGMTLSSPITGMVVHLDTAEAILMITFGQSTFCSEVVDGVSAIERGSWSGGDYDVYVGKAEAGAEVEYVLTATEP